MFNLDKRWKLVMVYIFAMIFSLSGFAVAEPLHEAAKEGDLAKVKRGVRLILRSKLGKMTVDEKCPEMLPAIAQDERSKCKNSLAAIYGPSHA